MYEQNNQYGSNRQGNRNYGRPQYDRSKRNPIPEGFSLFYLSIVCPPEIEDQLQAFKDHMDKTYGCRAAAKSPAHITIVPPFRAEDTTIKSMQDFVETFNIGVVPFDIELNGYGQFGDRVLFVDVTPNEALNSLEKECNQEFGEQFPSIIFRTKPDFNPHVTIATRDIPEGKLEDAKAYFEANHPFKVSFNAKAVNIMQLQNGWWKEIEL